MALLTPEELYVVCNRLRNLRNPDFSKKNKEPDYFVSRFLVRGRYGFVFLGYKRLEGRITAILEFLQNARREIGYNVLDYHIDPLEPGRKYFFEGRSVGFRVGVFVTLDLDKE